MEKIKANKVWITVIVIGVVIIGILILMLNQQKQANLTEQKASYTASVKASSSSQVNQDQENVKLYAKKAAKMKGHILNLGINEVYYTTWNSDKFEKWAKSYLDQSDDIKNNPKNEEKFGTSSIQQNDISGSSYRFVFMANNIISGGAKKIGYFETVKAFNKAYPAVNPDDIIK